MTIIGTSGNDHICVLSDDELRFIMFGNTSIDGMTVEQKDLWNKKAKLDISICELSNKARYLESIRHCGEYNSVRNELLKILDCLTPVENFIKEQQDFMKGANMERELFLRSLE